MTYNKLMGSSHPGLIMILIDQSGSMSDPYTGGSKAAVASQAVNRVINEIVEASQAGEEIKDRCYLGIIGYGVRGHPNVEPILGGMISQVAQSPLEVVEVDRQIPDGAGGLVSIKQQMPIWVKPKAENGTPMERAFEMAIPLVEEWTQNNPDNFPPVVINITDGEPNEMSSAEAAARKLMQLGTSDGKLLLFNAHISNATAGEIKLPNSNVGLYDRYAKFLYDISSELPDRLVAEAEKAGFAPQPGARGFIFNAGAETLIKLLTFGTVGTLGKVSEAQYMR